jgi:hypothetical protein
LSASDVFSALAENEETVGASCEKGCKTRTFKIGGEVTVCEEVTFQTRSRERQEIDGNGNSACRCLKTGEAGCCHPCERKCCVPPLSVDCVKPACDE